MDTLLDWLTLSHIPGLGPTGGRRLIDLFGGPRAVLNAGHSDLLKVPGIKGEVVEGVKSALARKQAEKELLLAERLGVSIIVWADPIYPANLRTIHDPPFLLYVKGSLLAQDSLGVAIVGARKATDYGLSVAERISGRLAKVGITIISGLAAGIDTAAHCGALASGGRTIAVLGCGLDRVYPANNIQLYKEIALRGAIVSEYPFGTKPEPWRFPVRNRIISGLALGVVVVEAGVYSGSLITANLALEQGREVFAIPGRVDSKNSEGTHGLLQQGAKLVQTEDDILEELHIYMPGTSQTDPSSRTTPIPDNEERMVFEFLDVYPKNVDEIIAGLKQPAQKINELLLRLELAGFISVLPGRLYQKKENLKRNHA